MSELRAACHGRDPELDGWPTVSVVVPVRNEAPHLGQAVASILAQDYPGSFDVCLAVAPSDDGTEALAAQLAGAEPRLSVVTNPAGVTPAGLNAAIAATTGEIVVRVDGHATLSPGYVRRAVETMCRTGAVNVGGRQVPMPETPFEETVAAATTSWMGTGGATYRLGGAPGPVDTVYLGVFDRAAGDAVGWFDESLIRNQDYELNIRLRNAGGTVWFDPELWVGYRPRGSWQALAKQYYEYGWWKAEVVRRHPGSMRLRQLVAATAPIGVAGSVLAGFVRPRFGVPAASYAVVVVGSAAATARRRGDVPRLTATFACQQGAWSCGFVIGVLQAVLDGPRPSNSRRATQDAAGAASRTLHRRRAWRGRDPYRQECSSTHAPEVHLCDNYSHLLRAIADLAGRKRTAGRPLVLFIDDQLPLGEPLRLELEAISGAEIHCVSDRSAMQEFERLPSRLPGMLRRNLSWHHRRPLTPFRWAPGWLEGRTFETAYVYHPGFFLSKVVAGRSHRIVMRDSGYSNYVHHRVPWHRAMPRLLAGRSPIRQTWGEERWVDEIEVNRPDQLPRRVRHKASKLTLDEMMDGLTDGRARRLAQAFWGEAPMPPIDESTAVLITQPIEVIGICSAADKLRLYSDIVARLRAHGLRIVVKPHPREHGMVLPGEPHLPAAFPIEAWPWLGQPSFAAAVSLNSAALADDRVGFARQRLQLIPPTLFYATNWEEWPSLIDAAFAGWSAESSESRPTESHGAVSRLPESAQ